MNIVKTWQKQVSLLTKKDMRAILLLSYKRQLAIVLSFGYLLVPFIIVAATFASLHARWLWPVFNVTVLWLSQFMALLLRPSMYKKDIHYVLHILKNNLGYMLLFSAFSLLIPFELLSVVGVFAIFFQFILADGRIRLGSFFNMARATGLLLWYDFPAVFLITGILSGVFWGIDRASLALPLWISGLLWIGVLLLLSLFVALMSVIYTASVYEHEEVFS